MSSPIARAAKEDTRVAEAMQSIANATEELYLALSALGENVPEMGKMLGAVLPGAVGPSLCEEAVLAGRDRSGVYTADKR